MISQCTTTALLWLGVGFLGCGSAGTAPSDPTGIPSDTLTPNPTFERIWSAPVLYQNENNPLLQELSVLGQLQMQYAAGADDSGNFGTDDRPDACTWGNIEVRRFRLGLKARAFHSIRFLALWDLNPDFSPRIYQRTPETYLTYAPCDAFNLSIGKTELKFTREQEISSREYLTFERSQLVNQLYGGELTGAWITGKNIDEAWSYELGAYDNSRRDEWTQFDGGTIVLAKIGYNYAASTNFDTAFAELHYLHNTEPGYTSPNDPPSPPYSDAIAISNTFTSGRFGMQTEAVWANGVLGKPDVWGISAIPSWSITEKLQAVALLEYANSQSPDGIVLPTRYEACSKTSDSKSGDSYISCYTGLNYYVYGDKMKFMSGVKYSHLAGEDKGGDFNGWTWLAGLRMAF